MPRERSRPFPQKNVPRDLVRSGARHYVSPRERALTPEEHETRRIAYALKEAEPDPESLRIAADEMAMFVRPRADLVPIPSSSGDLRANRSLAAAIAQRIRGRVVDALARRAPVESSRLRRCRGQRSLKPAEHGFVRTPAAATLRGEPVFIDNVTTTGHTFHAAFLALGRRGMGVAFAIARSPEGEGPPKHRAQLHAEVPVRDQSPVPERPSRKGGPRWKPTAPHASTTSPRWPSS